MPVTAKSIVSPSFESASAWRNEPGPLSFVLVTVMTIGVGDGVPERVGLAGGVGVNVSVLGKLSAGVSE